MPLTAVTGLKINRITRSLNLNPSTFPPNLAGLVLDQLGPDNGPENALLKPCIDYTFDLEWLNPNSASHWTEVTVTDSGTRKQITSTYVSNIVSPLTYASINAMSNTSVFETINNLYLGKLATTATTPVNHLLDYQNSNFRQGINTFSTLGCRIFCMEGTAPRTITIKVAVRTDTENVPTTITQTISLSGTVSELKGPTVPTLLVNGGLSVRYIDPFIRTESDAASVSATLLGVGNAPAYVIPHSIYSETISGSDVRTYGKTETGKFYGFEYRINYGKALTPITILESNWFHGTTDQNLNVPGYYYKNALLRFKEYGLTAMAWYFLRQQSGTTVNSQWTYLTVVFLSSYWNNAYHRIGYVALYPWEPPFTGSNFSTVKNSTGLFNTESGATQIQYSFTNPPSVETTAAAVVRTVANASFTYVVKATSGGPTSASTGATSFSLGTLPAGVTATIDSSGTITGAMSAVGTYTISVSASNYVGTTTGSIKFTCLAFVGNDSTLEVSAGEPISFALTASAAATYSLVSVSSNVPTGTLSVVNGRLSGILRNTGSYSATLRATMTGVSPVTTDDFTVIISVKELAQPLSVRATNIRRVVSPDKTKVSYYGVLEWFNNEVKSHTVRVTITDSETSVATSTSFPNQSQRTGQILLGTWNADTTLSEKSFNISVYVVGDYSTSAAGSATVNVSLAQKGALAGQLNYDDVGNLNLPIFDLAETSDEFDLTVATLGFKPDLSSTPQISSVVPPPSVWKVADKITATDTTIPKSSLQFTTSQQVYGLRDGGKYAAEAVYSLAGAMSVSTDSNGKKLWSVQSNKVVSSVSFEYYYRGLQAPVITSPLSVTVDVGNTFQYQIVALGASSFGATFSNLPEFSINTSSGFIEGMFTSEGLQVIPISATNRKGTSTRSVSVTVRDFYADPKSIKAIVNRFISQKLEVSRSSTWIIVSGAPAGLSLITDTIGNAYLTGAVAATGSYSVLLRATQKNYTPTRSVDVVYTLNVLSTEFSDPSEMPTTILTPSNLSLYQSEKPLLVGDRVALAFKSDPVLATWTADGLPPGLKINPETGAVSGVVRTAGSYVAQIIATAFGRAASLPLVIAFEVDPTTTATLQAKASGEAINRLPWLASRWDLIDLQILARSRVVQSSLSTTGDDKTTSLKFKIGDDLRFGVFFIDGDNAAFAIEPSRVRLTIRPINNVDDPLILETVESPSVTTEEDTPYYVLTSVRGVDWNAESMSVVEDWVLGQQSSKTTEAKLVAPLNCVAEIEWIKDGKSYSSESFPVSVELDVNR